MRRLTLTLALAAFAAALLLPAAALAKGPSAATITGPGKTLHIAGNGESGGSPLGDLSQDAGFFPAAYGQEPDPMLPSRPTGRLGPKFGIHYVVPDGSGHRFRITQDLYPYAAGSPVTYMKPGQRIFGMGTRGGWYRADAALERLLVRQGLPARAQRASSGASLALFAGLGIPGALALAAAALFITRRRRQAEQ
jgi:hypothetical protein